MVIYTSIFCFFLDFVDSVKFGDFNVDHFLRCFLFCEYDEDLWFDAPKVILVELIDKACPELGNDQVYTLLDCFVKLLTRMNKNHLICYSRRLQFSFPWQPKSYISTSWEEYEDFFFERIGILITFDKCCLPYFTLYLQLIELEVGFVLK